MTGLFDTHAHLYDKAFDKDREDVIARIFKTLDYAHRSKLAYKK